MLSLNVFVNVKENTSICGRVLKKYAVAIRFLFAHNIIFYIPFEYTVTETFFAGMHLFLLAETKTRSSK